MTCYPSPADALRALLNADGISQAEAAEICGVTQQAISSALRGRLSADRAREWLLALDPSMRLVGGPFGWFVEPDPVRRRVLEECPDAGLAQALGGLSGGLGDVLDVLAEDGGEVAGLRVAKTLRVWTFRRGRSIIAELETDALLWLDPRTGEPLGEE